jgi:hypothetical protein
VVSLRDVEVHAPDDPFLLRSQRFRVSTTPGALFQSTKPGDHFIEKDYEYTLEDYGYLVGRMKRHRPPLTRALPVCC